MVRIIVTIPNWSEDVEFLEILRQYSIDYTELSNKGHRRRYMLNFTNFNRYSSFIYSNINRIDSCIFVEKEES